MESYSCFKLSVCPLRWRCACWMYFVHSCWRTADRQTITVQRRMWKWSRQHSQAYERCLS